MLAAARAVRGRRPWVLSRACRAFPKLCEFFSTDACELIDADAFHQFLTELNHDYIDRLLGENQASSEPPPKKNARNTALQSLQAAWSPKLRRLSLAAVLDSDGNPAEDPTEAATLLQAHWSRVFAPRRVEPDALQEYLPFVQVAPQLSSWTLTYPQFQELVEKLHDSAPGPDGIPYSVWRAHDNCTRILYDFYLYFLASQRLPDDFNEALGVFLPKGSQPGDDIL
eukprot:167013-Pyramimonas_sp.AAC.1